MIRKFGLLKSYLKIREIKLMQKQAGFTTLELLVVIGIVAILSAIALPNFLGWKPAKQLQSAASEVKSALQTARLTAVKENICVTIEFDPANDNYRIFSDDGDNGSDPSNACNGSQDANEPTTKSGGMPGRVSLVSVDPQPRITFNSRGFPGAATTVTVQTESIPARTVELSLTGSTRIN